MNLGMCCGGVAWSEEFVVGCINFFLLSKFLPMKVREWKPLPNVEYRKGAQPCVTDVMYRPRKQRFIGQL